MKQETNNEIDLLLRRMGRRDGGSMGDADTPINERHLDADELSAYAENVLPPATRTRYTEHLAACSTCRRIVTQLSVSPGAARPATVETVRSPGGLKAFLASLFSPMVLRYAVPAVGLIVVAAIGFVVMRQQAREPLSARADMEQKRVESPAQPVSPQAGSAATAPLPAESERGKLHEESEKPPTGGTQQPVPLARDSKTGSAATVGGVARPVTEQQAEAPPPAATPAPAAPKAAASVDKETEKREDTVAKKQPEAAAQPGTADAASARATPSTRGQSPSPQVAVVNSAENKAKPTPSRSSGFLIDGVRSAARRRPQDEKDNAETRSIAGRRFRNERGIWIDTEYDSSIRTVNVARGSEQYRALVADEPAIGTIAKQLDGEVIVVWKGRAYRIR